MPGRVDFALRLLTQGHDVLDVFGQHVEPLVKAHFVQQKCLAIEELLYFPLLFQGQHDFYASMSSSQNR
jgi:hypothetical protein